jgi:hypothetical protein
MASIQEMLAKAAESAGTSSPVTVTDDQSSGAPEAPQGIQIERQDVEHVRGQAKSGLTM